MNNLLSVDGARLWHAIEYSSRFGATAKGGIRRLTLTDEDRRVRDWFQEQCKAAGCEVYIDEIGSMFAIRPGRDRSKPCVGVGSHLDTQPAGGKFDGILGVCAALEVVRTLNDANIETDASVCIVNWTNEEGSRFSPAMMGSAVHIGSLALSHALAATDREGISVASALDTIGYRGRNIADNVKLGSFIELHIEQGPRLEAEGAVIGVVESAYGVGWYDGRISGFESHAGSTPMGLRRDAMTALAELVLAVEQTATTLTPDAVGTVGEVTINNASRNVIPGDISFTIDCRFATEAIGFRLEQGIRRHCEDIADRRNVQIDLRKILDKPATNFNPELTDRVADISETLKYKSIRMVSGAGHDACNLAAAVPTALIFIPCENGVSHNESEWANQPDCEAGANVLLHTVLSLAKVT